MGFTDKELVLINARDVKAASVILDAKLRNAPDLAIVIQNNCKRLCCSAEEIYSALNFKIEPQIANQLLAAKQKLLWLLEYDDESFERLRELQQPYDHYVKLLMSIPGIKERAARLLFAELCPNLEESFLDSEHFCSWLGICPGDNTSAGKQKSGKCPKGNKWFRRCLIQCAQALAVSKRAPYYERFMALKLRRGRKRIIVALAHFLSRVIYSVLTSRKAFTFRETSVFRDVVVQRVKQSIRQLKKILGVSVINGERLWCDFGTDFTRLKTCRGRYAFGPHPLSWKKGGKSQVVLIFAPPPFFVFRSYLVMRLSAIRQKAPSK